MAGELDKINEIFRIHDEKKKTEDEEKREKENNASEKTPGETEEKKEPSKTGRRSALVSFKVRGS